MAYPGLILANAALGEGVETHLFFTFWGFDMINKKTMGDLKFTMLGNTATHMPQGLGGLPGMTAHGHLEAEEVDRRARRARGARVPRADRRLRRSPVGLPDVGGHEPPDGGGPLRGGRGHHQRQPTSSRRPRAPSCSSSERPVGVPSRGPSARMPCGHRQVAPRHTCSWPVLDGRAGRRGQGADRVRRPRCAGAGGGGR